MELADIKLAMTDKQAFLAKVHSEAADNADNKDKEKSTDEELSAEMDALQSADVLVLNELDWGMNEATIYPWSRCLPMRSR